MDSKTATALGVGIVSVVTPLVFPRIPLPIGIGSFAIAGGLFLYASKDWIRARLPARWRKAADPGATQGTGAPSSGHEGDSADTYLGPEEPPAELTLSFVRRLAAQPISPKTLKVLRLIASAEAGKFHLKDAVGAVPEAKTWSDLTGVWSGLTRRTRKILDDPNIYLISWRHEGVYDDAGNYVDHVGEVSQLTHTSLRKHFGLPEPSK